MRRIAPRAVTVAVLCGAVATASGGCETLRPDPLRFWQFWDLSVIQPMVDRFESLHPGVRVEVRQLTWKNGLEQIQASLASGEQPDLCELGASWLARFGADGMLEDMTAVHEVLADSFLLWDSAAWRGAFYGLPWVHGPRALYFNRELFRRAGLDPDSPPVTWDEMLAAARAVDALDPDISGFGQILGERYVDYKNFLAFVWGNGGRVLDDAGTVAVRRTETLEALEFYRRLADFSYRGRQPVLDRLFARGRLGMHISGAWNLRRYGRDEPELDFGVALVPRPAAGAGEHASFTGSELLVVFRGTDKRAACIELARYLRGYPQARILALADGSVFPSSRRVFSDTAFTADDRVRVFLEQSLTSRAAPSHPAWIEMEGVLNRAVGEVLRGRRAPRWCLRTASEEIGRIVARYE